MSAGSLAALGLAAALATPGGDGPCTETEPTLYLESPGAERGVVTKRFLEGEVLEIDVIARLRTAFSDPKDGVQGYSISVVHGPGLELKDLSTEGLNIIADRGFESTRAAKNASGEGFISAAAVCDCMLPPAGDFPLVRARYRVTFDVEHPTELETWIEYRNGLMIPQGAPISNEITVQGRQVVPCTEGLILSLRLETPIFLRGDANYDDVLDVSDPVTLLRTLFRGEALIRCDDAGDVNDDGKLDISDAIHVFNYLFRGGPPPTSPFPDPDWDPTADDLGCRPAGSG